MRTLVPVLVLTLGMSPTACLAQVLRETPPTTIQNARHALDLRAVVACGAATTDTYLELASVEVALGRFDDAVRALRGGADLESTVPEVAHRFTTMAWQYAARDMTDPAGRLSFVREDIALKTRVLTVGSSRRRS